ncbi:hypothetical protein [Pseudomonas sp. PSKL.D1]|uniref:hypothetical protein n=1 Tax=Pseudomonas sp. PSKL.D1 TaxID=3029060 RepID=UPI002381605C|nr:hypothetical protein [Pseudomonas sp. PSKL.D1]WDY55583.1 hypothetical protein PVV54_13260 [Pseudomonas sp. PSKL.D1]
MSHGAFPFFDHSQHKLAIQGDEANLGLLGFSGEVWLSHPFTYGENFPLSGAVCDGCLKRAQAMAVGFLQQEARG